MRDRSHPAMKRVSAPVEACEDNENLTHRRYRAAIAGFVTHTARLIYNNSRRLPGGNFSLKPSPPPGGYPIQVLPNGGYLGNLYRHYKNDLTGPASGLCLSPRELKLWPIDQTILPSACPNGAESDGAFLRETFTLPVEAARLKAREILNQASQGGYMAVVEHWRQLPDGQIEFAMRRLRAAN